MSFIQLFSDLNANEWLQARISEKNISVEHTPLSSTELKPWLVLHFSQCMWCRMFPVSVNATHPVPDCCCYCCWSSSNLSKEWGCIAVDTSHGQGQPHKAGQRRWGDKQYSRNRRPMNQGLLAGSRPCWKHSLQPTLCDHMVNTGRGLLCPKGIWTAVVLTNSSHPSIHQTRCPGPSLTAMAVNKLMCSLLVGSFQLFLELSFGTRAKRSSHVCDTPLTYTDVSDLSDE